MRSQKPFFPTQPKAQILADEAGVATGYENKIEGGVTIREMFALEIFKAMLSNAQFRAVTVAGLRELALRETDIFLKDLGIDP